MDRFRLTHILLCLAGLILPLWLSVSAVGQNSNAGTQVLPAPYQKWLDEDVHYLITDEERAEFVRLETDQQRDKFVEDFWQRRNPSSTPEANPFKEEHYRRLAYSNQQFAANVPGWKTDRGRIYILHGPPDEREQHPANRNANLPEDASPMRRYATDTWIYNFLPGVGRRVFFIFVDKCGCGEYQLYQDPTKGRPRRSEVREKTIPVKQVVIR